MKTVLAAAVLLVLSACAADTGGSSSVGDSRSQCLRACRQSNNVCTDSGASRSRSDILSRGDSMCEGQLRQCQARCGL